jgi:predicted O-linked N-acetylglucosamine transferase (SPINDLY family)
VLQKAFSLHQKGQLAEAATLYRKILSQNPKNSDALHLLGVIELQRQDPSAAMALIDGAIKLNPNNAVFLCNRGNALKDLKRFDEALASYDRALAIKPDFAEVLNNRGLALQGLMRLEEAVESYRRSLAIKPDHVKALNNLGFALHGLKRFDGALANYDHALAIMPDYVEAFSNRGNTLQELKRFEDALMNYDLALAIRPGYAEALNNRGAALQNLKRFDDALASYNRALTIRPDYAEAHNNRGKVLTDLNRRDEALASIDRALAIQPDYVDALDNRANTLRDLKRFDEALTSAARALAMEPDNASLFGLQLSCKMSICEWYGLDDDFHRLSDMVVSGKKASEPFSILATPLSAALQRACSETYIREKHPPNSLLTKLKSTFEHSRIRLGYFSADFRNHAVAYAMAELFERHDREKFEVIGFSFGPVRRDAMRVRLEKAFDRFFEVGAMSDKDVALLVRNLEIDIAIDLNGFTQGCRTDVFAMRSAPIQVNYLGYPGTMGAEYIDYLIADPTLIPEDHQNHYAEKIVYLPDTYMPSDSTRTFAKAASKAECGLPELGFVFCCFNNAYKIVPDIFDIWMRLLKRVQGSVLWLPRSNDAAMRNLRLAADARCVDPQRIVFARFLANPEDHLARLKFADLFLDTVPYNAHATASDALWAGLPILTCLGKTFPGRVAASLLSAVGLPDLITHNLDEYEALGFELANDPQKLRSLRQRLEANRLTHPLFNAPLFTKQLESAYVAMWRRHRSGLRPEHIHVPPVTDIAPAG